MNIDNAALDNAISRTIAERILKELDEEHRNELIARSIAGAIKNWNVQDAILKVVASRAAEVAAETIQKEPFASAICLAVREGIRAYTDQLKVAVTNTIIEAMHGKDSTGGYSRPGAILGHMKRQGD